MSPRRRVKGPALRRFTLGSGPLKRTSDRLEHLGRVVLVCVLLVEIAVAHAVATAAYTQGVAMSAAQVGTRQQVTARLRDDAQPPMAGETGDSGWGSAWVTWTDDAGSPHESDIAVPVGAQAGSTVHIWVNGAGERTSPPLTRQDAVSAGIGYGLLTYVTIAALALAVYRLFRRHLDRDRDRNWTAEWADIEPVWSRMIS